jgi:hypothetical protein
MDPGDDIICDSCNAEILDPTILLVDWGKRVMCGPCYRQWYALEKIQYRRLKPDGTLSGVVRGVSNDDRDSL